MQKGLRATGDLEVLKKIISVRPDLSQRRQCQLLGIHRSNLFYKRTEEKLETLKIMRLIDEVALINEAESGGWDTDIKELRMILKYVPTISAVPVVRGEWMVTDAYPHRVYCSLCYKTNVPNEESLFERNEYPKFCMWCGAKMEDKPC